MEPNLKESLFEEAFKIITINKNKANSLRQNSLKNKNDNDNLKIIQYLGELEYDLKTIYDILRDLKSSYFNMQSNLNNPKIKKDENIKEEQKYIKKDIKKDKKEQLYLKNDFGNKIEGNNKTYVMTSNQFEDNHRNNNIIDYFVNSYPRKGEYEKRMPRSMSCKSYIGNWNSNPNVDNLNNNYKYNNNNIRDLEYRNYLDNKFRDNDMDGSLSKDKTFKLNFDYDAYLTDYSLNRTNKNDLNNSGNDNNLNTNSKQNLNLSDLKNENDLNYDMNNKFNVPSQNKIGNPINNYNIRNINENQYNKEKGNNNNNNNIFTFSDQKNNNNAGINNYNITFDPKNKQNFNNNINSNDFQNNNIINKNIEDNISNNKNIDFNNDRDENISNSNNFINNNLNNKFNPYNIKDNNRNLNQNNNNNQNYINYNNQLNNKKDNNTENNYDSDEELLEEKREIIRSIISEIMQDKNKLEILKKELGDDIGQKLLNGNISEEELYKVAGVLKNYQINSNKKAKNKYYTKKKFNQPSDKILLKESLNDKRYNFREFPRGWNSTKDYFVNNGSTFLKIIEDKNN